MVYALHLAALLEKKDTAKEVYDDIGEVEKKVIHSEAMGSTKEAYLTCLFILIADGERYGGVVKMALGDNYLLGKQEYPQDLMSFFATTPSSHTKYDTDPTFGYPYLWVTK